MILEGLLVDCELIIKIAQKLINQYDNSNSIWFVCIFKYPNHFFIISIVTKNFRK